MSPIAQRATTLSVTPGQVLRAWPAHLPLALLCSSGASPWSRWSMFASPDREIVCREGEGLEPLFAAWTTTSTKTPNPALPDGAPPLAGGWIGWLSYQLGRELEPASRSAQAPVDDRRWPLACWQRCPAVLAFDHHAREWWVAGEPQACHRLLELGASLRPAEARPWRLGALASGMGETGYRRAVERVVEFIRAGDIFQANIAHRLSGAFSGSARGLMARLWDDAQPWYGAYIEHPGGPSEPRRALASISPELLVQFDPSSRRVVTRPMKGTRRLADPHAALDLERSPKDAAELNMIIDLMRNDLGRVCELGSVRVDEVRAIERHSTGAARAGFETRADPPHAVLQGVSTVSGILRSGCSIADLLGAAFPGGSVTGAPKIRAMQIIEELEPVARGPYCGSVGYISDTGHAAFSVAIRTALLTGSHPSTVSDAGPEAGPSDEFATGSVVDYSVGAGIVAASDPAAEWQETLDKAGLIRSLSR